MFYAIRHVTRFHYSSAVSESVMELRMRPRTEGRQRCLRHELQITPRVHINNYRDHLGNTIHHFDVPGQHSRLSLISESVVEVLPPEDLPASLPMTGWEESERLFAASEHWEMQSESQFARETELLLEFRDELKLDRRFDPLTTLRQLNEQLYSAFEYRPRSTRADSPIDECLQKRGGVCQDFAHIMTALIRGLRIPCRYVSGYIFQSATDTDKYRSPSGATHAWVEAYLPGLGWVGFDPTNNLLAGEGHIRTAIGRDYADVPPTKGVFRGTAASELSVSVRVSTTDAPPDDNDLMILVESTPSASGSEDPAEEDQQQQQQQ